MKKNNDIVSRMRQRITFQTESGSGDGGGGTTLSWMSGSTVWAEVRPVSSRSLSAEQFRGGKVQNRATHVIITRYIADVIPKMRILYGSRTFNIRSVVNVDEQSEFLEILVEEGVGE